MENKNETVAEIARKMRNSPLCWLTPEAIPQMCHDNDELSDYADRIEAVHKRELAVKDEEIERLTKMKEEYLNMQKHVKNLRADVTLKRGQMVDQAHQFRAEIKELRKCLQEAVRLHCDNLDGDCLHCIRCGVCNYHKWRMALEGGHE